MASKRELDKEKMFSKIMPTAAAARKAAQQAPVETNVPAQPLAAPVANPQTVTQADFQPGTGGGQLSPQEIAALFDAGRPAAPAEPDTLPLPVGEEPADEAPPPAETPPPQDNTHPAEAPFAADPPEAEPPAPVPAAPEPETEPPHPVNLAELLVEQYYPIYQKRLNGCPCERCRDDAMGMALNKIKPHYVPSDMLTAEHLKDRALITETVTALMKALFAVKRNPHHNENDPHQATPL